ncbi:hypothetical protein D0469_03450 [Peribacillus saganii]|uniref:Lipoprotein n=1 Tax=Peribacillus saganii TaxID=2303992 RepID=A0A372LS48_9BACI|nr:hypothetical protein [Peribacillus saganii]RFU71008.1 hypothetical protein D0469_03450 [Peribacillus saganii]
MIKRMIAIGMVALITAGCGHVGEESREPLAVEPLEKPVEKQPEVVAKKVEETPKEPEKLPISDFAKETAVKFFKETDGVKDASIEVKGDRIILNFAAAINDDAHAKSLGDSFIRTLSSNVDGSSPTKDYYGELFDGYHVEVYAKNEAGATVMEGFKTKQNKSVATTSWTAKKTVQPAPAPATSTATEPVANNSDGFLMSGENGFLAEDVIVGLGDSKQNLDDVIKFAVANNREELAAMILEGRAIVAQKGTPITLLEQGVLSGKIKIKDSGAIGWVPAEYLSETK